MLVLVGVEPVHRPPDHVGARLPQPARARDRRRRSAPHRDGDGGDRSTCALRAEVRPRAALRRSPTCSIARGLDRPRRSSTRTPPASTTFAAHVAAVHARARARGDRPRRRAARAARATRSTSGERVSFWWTMGVNQSHEGVRTAQAIINLALMTGNIGRPGTGANSITGQCNAMGSRLFSNTTNLLGGHDFTNADAPREGRRRPRHRRGAHPRPSRAWPTTRSSRASCAARSAASGSSPPTPRTRGSTRPTLRDVLDRLDFLVVQDMYATTETAQLARPRAARRRLGREGGHVHQLRAPHRARSSRSRARPGQALADFYDLQADRRGVGLRRPVRALDDARGRVPASCKELSRGQPVRHHRHRRLRACSTSAAACSGRCREGAGRRAAQPSAGCSRTAASSTPTAARASSSTSRAPCPSRPTTQLPVRAAHRPRQLQPVAHRRRAPRKSARAAQARTRRSPTSRSTPTTRARSASRRNDWVVVASRRGAMRARAFVDPRRAARRRCSCRCTTPTTNRLTLRGVRPALAPAGVQALRRARPPRKRGPGLRPRQVKFPALKRPPRRQPCGGFFRAVLAQLGFELRLLLAQVPGDLGVDVLEQARERRLGRDALRVGQRVGISWCVFLPAPSPPSRPGARPAPACRAQAAVERIAALPLLRLGRVAVHSGSSDELWAPRR